jgi:hypothetical protein
MPLPALQPTKLSAMATLVAPKPPVQCVLALSGRNWRGAMIG